MKAQSPMALAATLAAACLAGALPARAEAPPVVLMLEPERRIELAEALRVELAGREVEVLLVDPPRGETALARAADAQAGVRFVGGLAAVYLERSPEQAATVRAVGPDGDHVRHAPLPRPIEEVDAGVFAVVAHSLIEELLGPPEAPLTVRVQVSVDAPGRELTSAEGRLTGQALEQDVTLGGDVPAETDDGQASGAAAVDHAPTTTHVVVPAQAPAPMRHLPPSSHSTLVAPQADTGEWDEDSPLLPREGWFLEGGGVFAGVGLGAQLGLGWQLLEELRLSLRTSLVFVFDGSEAYMPALELARIGPDRNGRLDFGGGLGMVFIDGEHTEEWAGGSETFDVVRVGWAAHAFVGWTWELDGLGIGARGALALAEIEGQGPVIAPMATLHTELPL